MIEAKIPISSGLTKQAYDDLTRHCKEHDISKARLIENLIIKHLKEATQ